MLRPAAHYIPWLCGAVHQNLNREPSVPTPAAVVSVALGPEVRKFTDVRVYIDNDAQTVSIYQGDGEREIATAPLSRTLIEWYAPAASPGLAQGFPEVGS